MTIKDKAKELVNKYKPHVTTWDCYWDTPEKEENILADAKKCALICVDEIINAFDERIENNIAYWQEVKQEIEKL